MNIIKSDIKDLDHLIKIAESCTEHLNSQKIYQWNKTYPSKDDFKKDIEEGFLYVLLQNNTVQGCVCINDTEYPGYKKANWTGKNFYVLHRLMVNPNFEGRGRSKALLEFAEQQAKANNLDSIRLDCFTQNNRANRFYQKNGYEKRGETMFHAGLFNLYEKMI